MELIRLKDRPEMMGPMARWFSQKWGLPQRAYLESMEQCLAEEHPVPGSLEDLHHDGITPVYLITEHTAFYERYGWQFLCMAQPEDDPAPIRVYVHP